MGLKISQPIGTTNQGSLHEFYVRIENLIFDRRSNSITIVVAAYPSWDDAKLSFPIYDDLIGSQFSGVIGVEIIYNGAVMNYPVIIESVIDRQTNFEDLYGYSYSLVRERFSEIFGLNNITDEI